MRLAQGFTSRVTYPHNRPRPSSSSSTSALSNTNTRTRTRTRTRIHHRTPCSVYSRVALLLLLATLTVSLASAAVQLGDAGHYLTAQPEIRVLNPDGRAWSLTVHRFPWWIGGGWNRTDLGVTVTGPGGEAAFAGTVEAPESATVQIPAGAPGVYRVDVDAHSGLNFWYLSCTLDHAVIKVVAKESYTIAPLAQFNPFVPRLWHFWVPPGTERFRIRAFNVRGRSHREDHGLTVYSPRGQRMAVLWGQADLQNAPKLTIGKETLAAQEADIVVESGTAGRFWSVEIRMGDSHTYSDINLTLDGVPPYLAQTPEGWFDPETGKLPAVPVYDESRFVQSDTEKGQPGPGGIQHWTPAPSLGDPDGCELRCPARLALWNPENRPLKLVIGTYLPRNMFPQQEKDEKGRWKGLAEADHDHAAVTVTGAAGKALFDRRVPLLHLHGGERWQTNLITGAGVARIDVREAEHFWAYTYPATPAVLIGAPAGDGWSRFTVEIGTARNWYFRVPAGTARFQVRFATDRPADIADFKVNAPDRTVAAVAAHQGTFMIEVPPGLDGTVWHVRCDFGGATRFEARADAPRFPSLVLALDLAGVPPYLAPTREQWFDPEAP